MTKPSTITNMRNHKDTKTQRKPAPTIIDASFLCVFVSLWFLLTAFSVAGMAQGPVSVPAPEGWKQCPRCQNNKDRVEAKVKYKVEGHAFDPHDLSGIWGYSGIQSTFRNP